MKFDLQNDVAGVALSQDGKRLATHTAETVAVWDTRTLRCVGTRSVAGCRGLGFSPFGEKLAVVQKTSDGHCVLLFPSSLKDVTAEFPIQSPTGFRPTFNHDGNVMAVGQNLIDLTGKGAVKTKAEFSGNVAFHPAASELYASLGYGESEIVMGSYWLDGGYEELPGRSEVPSATFAMARSYRYDLEAGHPFVEDELSPIQDLAHPIQEIAYSTNGKLVAIGFPNLVVFAESHTLDFLPRKFFLGDVFRDHALARHDIARIAFGPKGLMAVATNVCGGQLSVVATTAGLKLVSGVVVYDLNDPSRVPWQPVSTSSANAVYTDLAFTAGDLVVAGIDLTSDRRPFVNRYSL